MNRSGNRARQFVSAALIVTLTSPPLLAASTPKKAALTTTPPAGTNTRSNRKSTTVARRFRRSKKELPLLPIDHPTSSYINDLGHRLAEPAPGYKFPCTFRVVKQKEINAFALPGGPIYMNIGTVQVATEAELAGVMGHEMAHVVMRHSTRQASRQAKASIPLAILSGVLGATVSGWTGSLAQMGISLGAGGVFTKYSRDAETEADMVGAQLIYDPGFDPQAMVTFFQKVKEKQGKSSGPSFLASHPDPGNRAKNVESILSRFPHKEYHQRDSKDFVAAKQALDNVSTETATTPPAPETGIAERATLRAGARPGATSSTSTIPPFASHTPTVEAAIWTKPPASSSSRSATAIPGSARPATRLT